MTEFLRTEDEMRTFIAARIAEETGPMFMGHPDRWYEAPGPKWRCRNDHVSSHYLRTELDGPRCLGCLSWSRSDVWLTFPEDEDGPIDA